LFGHTRGAFTGAAGDRQGLFELAQGGTVFLDEIGELPLDLQPQLLRVLEEREVRRIGSNRMIPVNVRVVAATNRDLHTEVVQGRFREDLFYRLEMILLELPPLAERLEDIEPLAAHALNREAKKLRRPAPRLSTEALAAMLAHEWPGNVRELNNVLARALILAGDRPVIEVTDLYMRPATLAPIGMEKMTTIPNMERELIKRTLIMEPNRKEAARQLGIPVSTLYHRLKRYHLE
jgi:transcriptional regulator with PAS, ATPase and Fis domain